MMSDPVYQSQVFTDPDFTNPQLNQSSGQELASVDENRGKIFFLRFLQIIRFKTNTKNGV